MTIAIASEAEKAELIRKCAVPGTHSFQCSEDGSCYPHYLLRDHPDNDMRYWLGYSKVLDAFFITNLNSRIVEMLLLRMEYNRLFQNEEVQTHQFAVRNVLKTAPKAFRTEMLEFLHRFYQEWAGHLEFLQEHERTAEQLDIIYTAAYIATRK